MARKKDKKKELFVLDEKSVKTESFSDNIRTLKDAMAPSEIDVVNFNTLKVGEH